MSDAIEELIEWKYAFSFHSDVETDLMWTCMPRPQAERGGLVGQLVQHSGIVRSDSARPSDADEAT